MMRDAEKKRDAARREAVFGGALVLYILSEIISGDHAIVAGIIWVCLLLLIQRDLMRACRRFKTYDDLITCAANLRRFAGDPRLAGTAVGEGLKELMNILGATS